jgi:signal transduction histidine kinase/tetratricopeptide (TPR) repeat protein
MKKYVSLLIIYFFFGFSFLSAQKLILNYQKLRDSLQTLPSYDTVSFFRITNKLNALADELKSPQKKADVLHIIGTYYYFRTDFNKTNFYYDSALSILKHYPDNKLKNLIDLKRSYIWIDQGDYNKAKRLYKIKEITEVNDTMAQILINMALGQIYQSELKHDSSLNKMYKALNFSTQKKDLYYEATSRNNIGGEYQTLGKTDQAKKEFLLAVAIAKKLNNKKLAANINGNIANIYIRQKKVKEALNIYLENLSFYKNTNFFYEISYMHLNAALCYSLLGDQEKTKYYAHLAIKIISEQKLPVETINIYSQVSNLYFSNKNYTEAINLSKEAISFSINNKIQIIDPSFYRNLSRAYEATGDNYNALLMNKMYINQKDSIDKVTNNKLINELIFKHELSEKEQKILFQKNENELLKKENELYNLNKNYYLIIMAMIFVITIILVFYFVERRIKKQKELYASQLINEIDKERERIAMDLHDDLGLGLTMARQKLVKINISNDNATFEIENHLADLLEKTRRISRELFPSTLKHLRFEEFISNLLDDTEKQSGIICSYEINDKIDSFNLETKTHLLRILQECIHNTIKYSKASAIRIEIRNINNKKTEVTYFDNGIGYKESLKGKGLGLNNIYQRGQLIGSDILIAKNENNKGVKLTIILND